MRRLTFPEIERAVIAELLSNERALELAPNTECDDFGEPLHRGAFTELRNLEAARAPLADLYSRAAVILAVGDRMAAIASAFSGKSAAGSTQIIASLGLLVLNAPRYGRDFEALFPRHLRNLRALGRQRRAIWSAA